MKFPLILLFNTLIICSCNRKPEQQSANVFTLKVEESKGFEVPSDSLIEPLVIPVDESKLRKVKGGLPNVVAANTNVHSAGNPNSVVAGAPKVCTPGQGDYSMPKILTAMDSSYLAGVPAVVIAKDPSVKDQNSQNFSSFNKLQGLKNGFIYSMYEDHRGNIWISTERSGVTRYDGQSFKNFTSAEGLPDDKAYSIIEDHTGNLWIGTYGKGVCKYDGRSFTQFDVKEGVINKNVVSILEDKAGDIWICTLGGGVLQLKSALDGSAGTFTQYTEKEGLPFNFVTCILEDKKGDLWFGTYGGGISRFDGTSFFNYSSKEGLTSDYIWKIAEDKNGNLWLATEGQGVIRYDGKSFTQFTMNEGLSSNSVNHIIEDRRGNIWFGTNGGGATKYDPRDAGSFTHYTEKEGLPNNTVYCTLEDRTGNLWFGTYGGGISKYEGKSFTHLTETEGLSGHLIYSILEDQDKNLWFGTSGRGISIYDGNSLPTSQLASASFTHLNEKEGLSNIIINSIQQDKKGNFWICTEGNGLIRFVPQKTGSRTKPEGGTYTYFTLKDGLSDNHIRSVLEDRQGNIWIATFGGGAVKYDGKSFTRFTMKQGLCSDYIFCMKEDKQGTLWFGADGGGVSRYDPQSDGKLGGFTTFNEKNGLTTNLVRSIAEDRKGNLWFGTGDGIYRYDGKRITHFTDKQGLSDNMVYSILEDRGENLWFGTRVGLSKLTENKLSAIDRYLAEGGMMANPPGQSSTYARSTKSDRLQEDQGLFMNYTYENGFLGMGCFANSICEDINGDIWIGTNDRLTVYHPDGDMADTIAPDIQLTSIQLFNEKIDWLGLLHHQDTSIVLKNGMKLTDFRFDGVTKWYDLPEHLSLAHNNNYLTFNFIGITQKNQKNVKYRYKLEGMDDHWSGITLRTESSYGNLTPGNYIFKIKAMNSGGYWSQEYHYNFTMRPPWWLTGWAYGFYILTFFGSIYGFIAYRSAALKKENKLLEEKVALRTNQLKTSLENLKSTQNQLIQSEKMASLGELTAGIAHEIQNPLNFVNNFSEINTELLNELKGQRLRIKGERPPGQADRTAEEQIETEILNDIEENEKKINHHGKRADAIVKGMLQHSQKSSGTKELTNINELAEEYLRMAYHSYKSKVRTPVEIKLVTHLDTSLPSINVIPQDIGRVFLNLVNNAFYAVNEKYLKYSTTIGDEREKAFYAKASGDKYEPTVSVTSRLKDGAVEFRIKDNGNGIPQKDLDKIFQPFFTTKPTGQGTGLGLSLAYDIVTNGHNGTLKVTSEEGHGAEFMIELPLS